jgi:hypothetical protein
VVDLGTATYPSDFSPSPHLGLGIDMIFLTRKKGRGSA